LAEELLATNDHISMRKIRHEGGGPFAELDLAAVHGELHRRSTDRT
jgi:hypothetical protein